MIDPALAASIQVLAPHGLPEAASMAEFLSAPAGDEDPFSQDRLDTLGELSRAMLADRQLRADPAAVSLAYWLRASSLVRFRQAFERRAEPGLLLLPAGCVFHLAPGNVDTVFVYSWALSYLCGNRNVVRVSGQQSPLLRQLLDQLSRLMARRPALAAANRFVTYPHDDAITTMLSLWSSHRVLWGGDETVSALRALPLSPHSSERAFGSKFSFSAVSVDSVLAASPETLATLAGGYFNDIFWFDQMACSSPQLIFWVGGNGGAREAIERFHSALDAEIARRAYRGSASNAVHRLNFAFDLACETDVDIDLGHGEFLPLHLAPGAALYKRSCGAGVFTHVEAASVDEVGASAGPADQTLTHFGFTAAELDRLARLAGRRGVDRLVPVGEALAFEPNWDGYDLLGDFLRRVVVRQATSL